MPHHTSPSPPPSFGDDAYDDADRDKPSDTRPPPDIERLDDDPSADRDPGFTDQPLETYAIDASDDDTADLLPPAEPDPTYFPPTDPVIGTASGGSPEVIGGFSPTAEVPLPADEVDRPTTGGPGDEALADAIRRELRADALTTDLKIEVLVEAGVAYLRGAVPTLDDTTNVAAVAERVPGVREVLDELAIAP